MTAPAWLVDAQGVLRAANEAALGLLGSGAEGRAEEGLFGAGAAEALAQARARLLAGEPGPLRLSVALDGSAEIDCLLSGLTAGEGPPMVMVQALPAVSADRLPVPPVCVAGNYPGELTAAPDLWQDMLWTSIRGLGGGQWFLDPERDVIRVTDSYLALLGAEPGGNELDRAWVRSIIHPDECDAVISEMARLASGEMELLRVDCRLRTADGSYLWVEATGSRLTMPDGRTMLCGSMFDISARKRTERELADALHASRISGAEAEEARAAQQEYVEILTVASQNSNMVPWYVVPETGVEFIGRHLSVMLGHPAEERIDADTFRESMHAEDVSRVLIEYQAILQGEIDCIEHDFRVRRADGSWCWIAARARRVDRSDEGLPPMVCGTYTDISERKIHEKRLAEAVEAAETARSAATASEEMLRIAATCGGMGLWSICLANGEAWMPPESFRNLGYEPGEFTPDHEGWRGIIHPDDLAGSADTMDEVIAGRREVYDFEQRIRHRDGAYHWYRTIARKIDRSDRGLPYLVAGAHTCIDQIKENEHRLAEAADAARRAGERLNTLADNAPGALFEYRVDAEGRIDLPYFSANLPLIMGAERAEIERDGSVVFRNILPEDLPEVAERIERSRRMLTRFEARFRVDVPGRGLRSIVVKSLPYAQQDGSVLWFGNLFDFTEQVESERRAAEAAEAVRVAHQRLNTLADNAPGALFEYRMAPDGTRSLPYFSAKLPDLLGVAGAALVENSEAFETHILPEDAEELHVELERTRRTRTTGTFAIRIQHPARGLRHIVISAVPSLQPDGGLLWYGSLFDITEQIEAERRAAEAAEEVRVAHDRLSTIADIAPVGLYEFRRQPDGRQDFPYTSARFETLLGYSRQEIETLGDGIFERVEEEDMPAIIDTTELSAATLEPWNLRFRIRHPQRGAIWLSGSSTPRQEPDGTIIWTGAMHDVSEDVRREVELRRAHLLAEEMRAENERQALHDVLTGLPNRRYYDQTMAQRLDEAQSGQGPRDCALIRIDLDHFKYVNDTLGHEAGDKVLLRVADVLRDSLRKGDFAARIGGDEFTILLRPTKTPENAREVVERIQERLAEPLMYEGRQCRFGASFGIAHTEDLTELGAELQLFADAALYRAKAGGRNRMEFFTTDLHQNILNDRRLAEELHEALEKDQFEPYFQAQISGRDGSLLGAETLLRWNHPEKGVLSPEEFMGVAEQLRIVPEIDRIMMLKTRSALQRWQERGLILPKISFNVSSGRMHDPDVVSLARSMRDGATKVTFELLESILVEEESDAFKFHLDMIREAGIDIEIDDFGSGHASIIGLMEIAPSALKIDKRIVAPVAREPRARNLVSAIVEIAETLGIGTVAEGVETPQQAEILRAIGCEVLQGYLFSRAIDEGAFLDFALARARRQA